MRLEELSDDLRREIWNFVHAQLRRLSEPSFFGPYFNSDGERYIERTYSRHWKIHENRVDTDFENVVQNSELVITNGEFNEVLDFLKY